MTIEINKLQSALKQVLGHLGVPFDFKSEITEIINQIQKKDYSKIIG